MGTWGPDIFSDDIARDVRSEYRLLLGSGKTAQEAEDMLIGYYAGRLDDADRDVFWFALALSEWKAGRLSLAVKEKALDALDRGDDLARWAQNGKEKAFQKRMAVLENLRAMLLSPPDLPRKIPKPTVHHCPWEVGSLLAYRIITNSEKLHDHPCFGKYVLLRVVRVQKHPVSRLFDTGYYDESMDVALYNWIGDVVPEPGIVERLHFIPIMEPVKKHVRMPQIAALKNLPEKSQDHFRQAWKEMQDQSRHPAMSIDFDWLPIRGVKGEIVCLGHEDGYPEKFPYSFDAYPWYLAGYCAFDITLAKKFEHLQDGIEYDKK